MHDQGALVAKAGDRPMTESSQTPVFIGGAGRSGTTLVVDLLGTHPNLSPVYETNFVTGLAELYDAAQRGEHDRRRIQATLWRYLDKRTATHGERPQNKRDYERYVHGPHYILFSRNFAMERARQLLDAVAEGEMLAGVREFVVAVFEEHCRLDGKSRWLSKTPNYVLHLDLLRELFPDMRFIHCVRDGRDVACSVLTRRWGPKEPVDCARWRIETVARGTGFGQRHPENYLETRFEEFVEQPEVALGKVLEWLGEAGDAGAIVGRYRKSVGIVGSRVGAWRTIFSAEDREAFHAIAGAMLQSFGYLD